jgi:hypothetical protein
MIDELCRVLAPGGRLVLGTPDYDRWEWVWIEKAYGMAAPGGYADEHISHYSRKGLLEDFARRGYTHEATRYILRGELILAFRKPHDEPRPGRADRSLQRHAVRAAPLSARHGSDLRLQRPDLVSPPHAVPLPAGIECRRHGSLDPVDLRGFYLHGEGQVGLFHPLHQLLYRLLPLGPAFNLELIANYVALFGGTVWFLRRLAFDTPPALFVQCCSRSAASTCCITIT